MLNDIAAFLKEMPIKHYLRGGLFSTKEPTLVFSIGGDKVEGLAAGARGGGVGYERSLEKDNDAPPLATGHSNPGALGPGPYLANFLLGTDLEKM